MSNIATAIIKAKIDAYFYANGIKKITGPEGNELFTDLLDSLVHFDDDYAYLNLQEYNATRAYKPGECCVFNFVIYQNASNATINNEGPLANDPSPWVPIAEAESVLGEFPPYDNATSYISPNTVRYSNKLYLCISPTTGNAPPNGLYWQEVSPSSARFGRIWATNTYYADKQVVRHLDGLWQLNNSPGLLSVDLLAEMGNGLWSPLANVYPITLADLRTAIAGNQIAVNRLYLITDYNVFLMGLTQFAVAPHGWLLAKNPDYQNIGDYSNGYGNYVGDWNNTLTLAVGDVVSYSGFGDPVRYARNLTGTNSNPYFGGANWELVQRGVYDGASTYSIGDVVIFQLKMFRNLTGAVAADPDGDVVNWEELDPMVEDSYIDEIDEVTFDIEFGIFLYRADRRGNKVKASLAFALIHDPVRKFQFGNDLVTDNSIENAVLDLRDANAFARNNKVYNECTVLSPVPISSGLFNCEFGLPIGIDLTPYFIGAVAYKKCVVGFSNFRVEMPGATILDFSDYKFVGLFVLSGGVTSIDEFANIPMVPFRFFAEVGESFDINPHTSIRMRGGVSFTLIGNRGDFIEFDRSPVGTFLNVAMETKRVNY